MEKVIFDKARIKAIRTDEEVINEFGKIFFEKKLDLDFEAEENADMKNIDELLKAKATFDFNEFKKIFDVIKTFKPFDIKIEMDTDKPIKISFLDQKDRMVSFYLAPKVRK
jgi:hypothetical protein